MNTKRLFAFVLAVLMLMGMTACGAKSMQITQAAEETVAAETTVPVETTVPNETAAPVAETSETEPVQAATALADGVYTVEFKTDSSMFHVNEAYDGKATLTVSGGEMVVHVTLAGKGFLNVFVGTAEEAKQEGAAIIDHTEDPVTYSDGYSETVYGFDIPVPAIEEDFQLAVIGSKGKWYDHTVSVCNPILAD